jgi:hypothetical protein
MWLRERSQDFAKVLIFMFLVLFLETGLDRDPSKLVTDNVSSSVSSLHHTLPNSIPLHPNSVKTSTCTDSPLAVHLTGGIGNHLFGAAFGYAHSMRKSGSIKDLYLIPDEQNIRKQQVSPMLSSLLSSFTIINSITLEENLTKYKRNGHQIDSYQQHWTQWCEVVSFSESCGVFQVVSGYFQNKAYFSDFIPDFRRLFAVPMTYRAQWKDYRSKSTSLVGPSWAIHVRRGDFVEKADIHKLLPLEYFAEGVRVMSEWHSNETYLNFGVDDGPVFIFSDDIQWTRQQEVFSSIPGVVFVDVSDSLQSFYFLILAIEDGVICSNSTFCWWAALLANLISPFSPRIFPTHFLKGKTLIGVYGPEDCGTGLSMPYMTLLDF